ncbi:MAG: hypothetical protein RL291_158 [Pseudomonadota bacterium]
MITEIGHFALILAAVVALLQTVLPQLGAIRNDRALMATGQPAALAQLGLVTIAFVALMHAFVVSDFSVENVYINSHSAKPLIYRISGTWGNHEGSMVLWVLILALFGAAVAVFGQNLPDTMRARVLSVQSSIALAFLIFILATSNPFNRLLPAPVEGRGLNPILQDPALALHPPFLYAGYVGFSIAFSFAIAALLEGRLDAAWARWVRPWTLAAWVCLTIGIAMGSWWAYYELGWGGFWFWDPVENASFMPWLLGTALLHSAIVMEKREALKVWTVLLAILTFSLSLMGTFIVRSGVLTSVHAFAVDPQRGVAILGIMAFFTGGGLWLYALRAQELRRGGLFAPISREGSLILNNLLLTVSCATVLFGTLYPLALESITGEKISVGPPYFNLTFGALMIPLMLAMPMGPLLAWKRGDIQGVTQRLMAAAGLALFAGLVIFALTFRGPWLAPPLMAVAVYVILGALTEWAERVRFWDRDWAGIWRRAQGLPRAAYGTLLGHAGVGLMLAGIVGTTAWQTEVVKGMKPGDQILVAGYTIKLDGVAPRRGPNYQETFAQMSVTRGERAVTTLEPAKRLYDEPKQPTTEAGIYNALHGDLYVTLGDPQPDGSIAVRAYFNPLVRFIWIGALLMSIGGLISLSDRRLRVGAPKTARRPSGPKLEPAE